MFLQTPISTFQQGLVTKLTRHEAPDLFDRASSDGQRSFHKTTSVEFKSQGQGSRTAGFSKSLEVGQLIVTRPAVVLERHGITTTCLESCAMRNDFAAETKKVNWEIPTMFWRIHHAIIALHFERYGIDVQIDFVIEDGSKSWVVISRGLDRGVVDISEGCKQSMHPQTAAQQDKSSSAERSVADMTFATRSKVKSPHTRSLEQSILPVKVPLTPLTRKIRIYVEDLGGQYPPPNLAGKIHCLSRNCSQSRKKFQ